MPGETPEDTFERERPPFSAIPQALLDADISDRAYRLYGLLDAYPPGETGCWPGRATLAHRLRCSPDSVDRAVSELEATGFLEVQRRVGVRASNRYRLFMRPRAAASQPSTSSRTRATSRTHAATPTSRTDAAPLAAPVRPELEQGLRTRPSRARASADPPPTPQDGAGSAGEEDPASDDGSTSCSTCSGTRLIPGTEQLCPDCSARFRSAACAARAALRGSAPPSEPEPAFAADVPSAP